MIRPYRLGDLWAVLPSIREEEVRELLALGGTPEVSLRYGIEHGETVTLEISDKIVGLAGVIDDGDYLVPWSVFTADICQSPITFLRECKRWLSRYDRPMMNVVDARNERAKRWLQWLGFTLDEPKPIGVNGELFHVYRRGSWAG